MTDKRNSNTIRMGRSKAAPTSYASHIIFRDATCYAFGSAFASLQMLLASPPLPPSQRLGCNWGSGGKAPRLDSGIAFMVKPCLKQGVAT